MRCRWKIYNVFGYKGKQVRDNIHSSDLVTCFGEVYKSPKKVKFTICSGGIYSNCSMLEAIELWGNSAKLNYKYIDEPRKGDHQWYISDLSKFEKDHPNGKLIME